MKKVDLNSVFSNGLVRRALYSISIQLLSLLIFGLGISTQSEFLLENASFILVYAGVNSIIGASDLGYSMVIVKGEELYLKGAFYLLILSCVVSISVAFLLHYLLEVPIDLSLLFAYALLGFWLHIVRALFDRIKWFVLGTFASNSYLIFSTSIPAILYEPKNVNEWWFLNTLISFLVLLLLLIILQKSKRITIVKTDLNGISWKQVSDNWKMSLVNFQGNLNGRIDRFLFPLLFGLELSAGFVFINEAAHRLLFITSSLIRFSLPYYGPGDKKLNKLPLSFKVKVFIGSTILNLFVIYASFLFTKQNIDNGNIASLICIYSISSSLVVLSQYEFFNLILKKSYPVIIRSQIFGAVCYTFFILVSNANLSLIAIGYLFKSIIEYIILKKSSFVTNY